MFSYKAYSGTKHERKCRLGGQRLLHIDSQALTSRAEQAFGMRLVLFTTVVTAVPRTCPRIG
jgi:hypothetical protein